MSSTAPRLPELSKEIAAYLNTEFGSLGVSASHNSNVIYKLEQLTDLKVDCWPSAMERPKVVRIGHSKVMTINIAIQQRAKTQELMDELTDLTDDILGALLSRRFLENRVYSLEGGFAETDIFDRFAKYEENVFLSVIAVTFQWTP